MTRLTTRPQHTWEPWLLAAVVLALLLLLLTPRRAGGQEIVVGEGQAVTRIAEPIATAEPGARVLPGTYGESPVRIDEPLAPGHRAFLRTDV
jgi:hypothetical protein